MADQDDKHDEEVFTIPDPSGTGELKLTRERLVALAQQGAGAQHREQQLRSMASRNRERAEQLDQLEGLQQLLDQDPAKAVKVVMGMAQDRSGGALGLTPEELGMIADDDDGGEGASGALSQALTRRLETIERQQRESQVATEQQRLDGELRASLEQFPDIKQTESGRKLFETMVRAIGASGSQASVEDIGETVGNTLRQYITESSEAKIAERERHAQDSAMRGGGAPVFSPPEKSFTREDLKSGKAKSFALDILNKARAATRGPGV